MPDRTARFHFSLNLNTMEPKKNPEVDVHRKRDLIFNFSLALSLLIVISAFKIAVPYPEGGKVLDPPEGLEDFITVIPITNFKKDEPAKPNKPILTKPVNIQNVKPAETLGPESPDPMIDQNNDTPFDFSALSVPGEVADDTTTFIFVEHKPEPLGGYPGFYKTLRENLAYPLKAKRHHATGRVYVEFTIDKSGDVINAKAIRGIGYGCDEEAVRVIKLTKWEPGKQRGRPVKVKMVLPVVFEMRE
jgi:periplasmic protein TonB